MDKRLYRSRQESVISGVCGGVSEYFDMDPSIVRIALVLITLATGGIGIIGYLVFALVLPLRPVGESPTPGFTQEDKDQLFNGTSSGNKMIGGSLIAIGLFFLARKLFWWVDFWMVAPVVCILIGIMIIYRGRGAK